MAAILVSLHVLLRRLKICKELLFLPNITILCEISNLSWRLKMAPRGGGRSRGGSRSRDSAKITIDNLGDSLRRSRSNYKQRRRIMRGNGKLRILLRLTILRLSQLCGQVLSPFSMTMIATESSSYLPISTPTNSMVENTLQPS